MKNFSIFKSVPMVIGFVVLFTIFVTKTSYSQNPDKKEKQKTVILKVTTDKDGKTTVIDTTFTTPEGADPGEIEEMAEKLQEEMKGLEKEMEEMQVKVLVGLPDSAMRDSIHKFVEKMVVLNKGPKSHLKVCRTRPGDFDYEFNVPCPPGRMPCLEPFDDDNWNGYRTDHYKKAVRFGNKGQTLNDLIGDIPMDKVKNYSIKNTKYGKKIVIEIED